MQYIIPLKMEEEKREKLNNRVTEMSDDIIVWSGYIPHVLAVCALIQLIVQHLNMWYVICHYISYVSVAGILISATDAIDIWLSMTWDDIEGMDRKKGLWKEIIKTTGPVVCWIANMLMFHYFGGIVG